MGVISCESLAQRIADHVDEASQLVICDLRFSLTDHEQGRSDYAKSHLPGAIFVDLHHDLADHDAGSGGRHPLPSTVAFGSVLDRIGITPDTEVVAYDAAGGAMAARFWWMLHAVGHHKVSVLDGGWPAWVAGGFPVSNLPAADQTPASPRSSRYPVPLQWPGVVTAEDVERVLASTGPHNPTLLVDARAPERFRGEVEPFDARAGHIPGAINLFNGLNLGPDGLHRPLEELRQIYRPVIEATDPIMYCGSGIAACHNLLMLHILGEGSARLYAGSWSDWSGDPARPGAVGE
jgi:thiosulfate/3-mercaptopyruvate sulfurtransferase